MTQRAREVIRTTLRDDPTTEVRFVNALTVDTTFLRPSPLGNVLFVNPVHRDFVDAIRARPQGSAG